MSGRTTNDRDWRINQLRITAFTEPLVPNVRQGWFESVTGLPAESSVSRVPEGFYHDEGPFGAGILGLEIHPGRIDWLVTPPEQDPQPGTESPHLGTMAEALPPFRRAIEAWLPNAVAITRLAFGAVLYQATGSKSESYEVLASYLPGVKIDPIETSEFLYRINRPRRSTSLEGKLVNRLSTWYASLWQRMRLEAHVSKTQSLSGVPLIERHLACVELDLSSAAGETKSIEPSLLEPLLSELIDLGLEISMNGDIK